MAVGDLETMGIEEFIRRHRDPEALWGFVHIPKTAGTSLVAALCNNRSPYYNIFARSYMGTFEERQALLWDSVRDFIDHCKNRPADLAYRLFSGHIRRQIFEVIRERVPRVKLFTYLRSPVDRVISDYRYQISPVHPPHEIVIAKYPSIIEFIADPINRNIMTKFTIGRENVSVEEAIRIASAQFEFVGICEQMAVSNDIVSAMLGMPRLEMPTLNTTEATDRNRFELTDELRSAIAAANKLDLALYEHFSQLLKARAPETDILRDWPPEVSKPAPAAPLTASARSSGAAPTAEGAAAQPPLFVLGCERAGTSVMLKLCAEALGETGAAEGWVWQSVKTLEDHFERVRQQLSDVQGKELSAFSLAKIPPDEILDGYAAALLALHQRHLGPGLIDKTPGPEAIAAAPAIKRRLRDARFICMKRRGIENVLSQLRRFPDRPFEAACSIWARSMAAWLAVRDELGADGLEIDQADLQADPDGVADRLAAFLGVAEAPPLARFLRENFPEKTTAGEYGDFVSLRNTGWDELQMQQFCDICGDMMAAFGYSMGGEGHVALDGELDVASAAMGGRWRVTGGNPWIATRGPGIALHPNRPGAPGPRLRLAKALGPGRYRFRAEVVVHDERCRPQHLVLSASGATEPNSWSFALDGGRIGRNAWEIPAIEVGSWSDIGLEVRLEESSPDNYYSAVQLNNAVFIRE